jgi:hypothetical protein
VRNAQHGGGLVSGQAGKAQQLDELCRLGIRFGKPLQQLVQFQQILPRPSPCLSAFLMRIRRMVSAAAPKK